MLVREQVCIRLNIRELVLRSHKNLDVIKFLLLWIKSFSLSRETEYFHLFRPLNIQHDVTCPDEARTVNVSGHKAKQSLKGSVGSDHSSEPPSERAALALRCVLVQDDLTALRLGGKRRLRWVCVCCEFCTELTWSSGTLRFCVSHRAAGTSRNCVYCVQPAEAARVGAGLRLITLRLQDYGNNRLPAADCRVPSQPAGWAGCGRLSPCCRGRFFTQSHDGRHLDSHCSWTKNSSAVLSPNTTKMTERRWLF